MSVRWAGYKNKLQVVFRGKYSGWIWVVWLRKSKNRAAVSGLVIKKLSVYLENSLFRCVWLGSGLFVDIVSENRLVVRNAARDLQRLIHLGGFRGKIDITKNEVFNYQNDSKDW